LVGVIIWRRNVDSEALAVTCGIVLLFACCYRRHWRDWYWSARQQWLWPRR